MNTALSKKQVVWGAIIGSWLGYRLVDIVLGMPLYDQAATLWFGTVWLFFAAIKAKGMLERGELGAFLGYCLSPIVVPFLLLDIGFNVVWGSIIFRERPKELLFTQRVQRHYDEAKRRVAAGELLESEHEAALRWALRLNSVDPGHIR